MYTPKRQNLRMETTALASGSVTAVRLDQLQPIASIAGGHTYLRRLLIEVDVTMIGNDTAVVGEDHVHDVFTSIMLRLPGLDRPVIELPTFAGSRLRYVLHSLRGKRQRAANGGAGGNITPASSAGTALRLKYEIPFYLPRGVREADVGMPIAFLREAADLELTCAPIGTSGEFGSAISFSGTVVRCTAELYERPEFVMPSFFSIQLFRLNQIQGALPVAGRMLHSLIEVAAQAVGVGQAVIASGDRTTVQVQCDGRMIVERVDSKALTEAWNAYVATARAEELPDPESGTTSWAPIFWPQAGPGEVRITQLPLCVNRPEYTFTGSDSSPDLIALTLDLNDKQAALARVSRAGVAVADGFESDPDAYLTPKTVSKQPTVKGPDGGARLPLRLHLQPVAGNGR